MIPRAASSKNIFEAKKIAEDILKLLENGLIDAAVKAAPRKSRKSKAVISGALLRFRKDGICFSGFPELFLCFLLFLRVAVGMPLQRRLAVSGFDFIGRGGTFDAEYFITVAFLTHRRICKSP